jgi:hypothetical protein
VIALSAVKDVAPACTRSLPRPTTDATAGPKRQAIEQSKRVLEGLTAGQNRPGSGQQALRRLYNLGVRGSWNM